MWVAPEFENCRLYDFHQAHQCLGKGEAIHGLVQQSHSLIKGKDIRKQSFPTLHFGIQEIREYIYKKSHIGVGPLKEIVSWAVV